MEFRWDEDNEEPLLLLDGKDHDLLPFIEPTFSLDEQQISQYRATLQINGVEITSRDDADEWQPHELFHEIHESLLDGEFVTNIELEYLNCETRVATELLDMLGNLNMPPSGLTKMRFNEWSAIESALNAAVIDRLVQKTTNLKELKIGSMQEHVGQAMIESLADLATQIISTSPCLTLIILNYNQFSAPSTTELMSALSTSPSLETID